MAIKLTWKEFKRFCELNGEGLLRKIAYIPKGKKYEIYVEHKGLIFTTEVTKGTEEGNEFENSFIPNIQPGVDERGLVVYSPTIWDLPGNSKWVGNIGSSLLQFQAQPGIENFFDIQLIEPIYLSGGRYVILNPSDVGVNDYIEFSIIDKDEDGDGFTDVLGVTVPAFGIFQLSKFVEKWWVYGTPVYEFKSHSGEPLIPGLYLRIGYMSTGTVAIDFHGYLYVMTNVSI